MIKYPTKSSLINVIEITGRIFCWIFVFLIGITRMVNNSSLLLMICTLSIIIAGLLGIMLSVFDKNIYVFYFTLFMLVNWALVSFARTGWKYSSADVLESICFVGIAYIVLTKTQKLPFYQLLTWFFFVFIVWNLVFLKVPIRKFMKDGTSYNYISVMMLFYISFEEIVRIKNKKKMSVLYPIMYTIVAILAYGRGGILTAICYLLFSFIIKGYFNKLNLKTMAIIIMFLLILTIYGLRLFNYLLSNGYLDKFIYYGIDGNGRDDYLRMFFQSSKESLNSFLTGGNPRVCNEDGNLHNFILQLYASFGFVFFIFCIFKLFFALGKLFLKKQNELLMILLIVLMRAFTDKLMFRNYFEPFFYMCLLFYRINGNLIRKKNKRNIIIGKRGEKFEYGI